MHGLPRIRLSGDLQGDYVVLRERGGGRLMVAPEQPDGLPVVASLKKTCTACPAQWEGKLEDGRALYVRYRWGELSVGAGEDGGAAIDNSMSEEGFHCERVGEGLDGYMDFEELKAHLYGLLDFGPALEAEDEREPEFDLEAFEEIFASRGSSEAEAAGDSEEDGGGEALERVGEGLREAEIRGWTCFSCGKELARAHEGDYFHADPDSGCTEAIAVPTSLVQPHLQTKDSIGAWERD